MQPITYSLTQGGTSATGYYRAISSYTDEVIDHAKTTITPIAQSYRNFLITFELEHPRSIEEYTYELINLGILWRAYGRTACAVEFAPFHFLSRLGEWRKTHPRLKPGIDLLRGFLLSLFLVPVPVKRTDDLPTGIRDLEKLVTWLEATGDFREDAFRYVRWLGFWGTHTPGEIIDTLKTVLAFADWFVFQSEYRMGSYTPNVDSFVIENENAYRWREDRFSCLRSRAEYHLNMVGAEIMNRAYRNAFLSAPEKTILAPGCMRKRTADRCEGIASTKGISCTGCEPSCGVNRLRETGKKNNFNVMVIPHSTDLSQWSAAPGERATGVVGIACLSVLVQGGWELQRNNIPAQCVLLNECGCSKHWHTEGFPTGVDTRELKRIVTAS